MSLHETVIDFVSSISRLLRKVTTTVTPDIAHAHFNFRLGRKNVGKKNAVANADMTMLSDAFVCNAYLCIRGALEVMKKGISVVLSQNFKMWIIRIL